MKKILMLLLMVSGITYGQTQIDNIVNRESGASVRAKMNQSFLNLYALEIDIHDNAADFICQKYDGGEIQLISGNGTTVDNFTSYSYLLINSISADLYSDGTLYLEGSDVSITGNVEINNVAAISGKFPTFAPFDMLLGYKQEIDYIEVSNFTAGYVSLNGKYYLNTINESGYALNEEYKHTSTYAFIGRLTTSGIWNIFDDAVMGYSWGAPYSSPVGSEPAKYGYIDYDVSGQNPAVTVIHKTVPIYATDIELKASLNNFSAGAMVWWYDSRGNELNPNWSPDPLADTGTHLHYLTTDGGDQRDHGTKNGITTSLSSTLGANNTRYVTIYPSLSTGGDPDTSDWLNPNNSENITWSYCLIDPLNGVEESENGESVWRPTEITGWTRTQK